jgi:hypothetical protein
MSSPTTATPLYPQLYSSEILDAARARHKKYNRIEFYGDLLIIGTATSLLARIGYYFAYGKPGGAAALPERS